MSQNHNFFGPINILVHNHILSYYYVLTMYVLIAFGKHRITE